MARVLITRRIPSSVLNLVAADHTVDVCTDDAPLSREDFKRRVADKDGLIAVATDRVDGDLLDAAPALKIVANIAVGYDNIDVPAARQRGVVVTNTPDVLTEATAEFTWALILAVARRVAEGDRLIRAGAWTGWALDFMLGTELRGKQLGIIGAGRIGRAVASKAPVFGMKAVFAKRKSTAGDPRAMSVDELLISSDVISLHTPLTPDTRHLIDRRALARMKRTALLVNLARGPVVDEEALVWALGERLIAGAALDVYEKEPHVHPGLLQFDNVVLAPHLGSATRETRTAMIELAARNVLAVLAGNEPLTPVR
ncbi:MAG: D-glycerate dehydrogenase [Acidobacteria bacterium]|nr:D-glycerate dehydrogenase [Acidobacteriota bacterium]